MAGRGYHHGDLRRALLDAAQEIVAESGAAAVTMSAVARRAGVSSGAPYRHFKDVTALMQGLWLRAWQQAERRIREAMTGAPSVLEGFRQAGIAHVRFAVEQPVLFRVLSAAEYVAPDAPEDPMNAAFTAGLRALFAGDPQAPLDPTHPLLQQLAARCLVHGLACLFVDGQHAQLGIGVEQAERLADALTRSLGQPSMDLPEVAHDASDGPTEPS